MSVNTPPNPNVDTFNNLYWIDADTALTYAEASKKFLKFPIAQGTETLQKTTVNGDFTLNNTKIHIGTNSGATSQGALSIAIGSSAGNASQATRSIAIGNNAGNVNQNQLSVAVGDSAGFNELPDSAIAIGSSAALGSALVAGCGARSICIGRLAKGGVGGNDSIAIGNNADSSVYTQSVALGYNALNSGNNQICLGTANENVRIRGTITTTGFANFEGALTVGTLGGVITANGGLTMGGANNITLGNGTILPTTGTQLGGCGAKIIIASATLSMSVAEYRTFTLPNAGTYLITTNIVFSYGGATSTAGTARYWWGTTSASTVGLITGSDIYGFIPANATSLQYISLSNQAFIYQTPATPVALFLNAYCVVTTTVFPTIVASSSYIQYTRIA
jgi:hypothetical protein